MSVDKILVTSLGFMLIGFIYWFFFGEKNNVAQAKGRINILVSGGYKPEIIKAKIGKPVSLIIKRVDPNSCLEEFILPDFKIDKYLPLNQEIEITINPNKPGTFPFHCGMNMYHGKIIVE